MTEVHRRTGAPDFHFEHAGSGKPFAWQRYKLKECWTLLLCLFKMRGHQRALVVHNWYSDASLRFTEDFCDRLAAKLDGDLTNASTVEPHRVPPILRWLTLLPAVILFMLPIGFILAFVRRLLPQPLRTMVVYCDAHLSGFLLVLAAREHGTQTFTLHHGLYRTDDPGSIMGVQNFVADQICLWDRATLDVFRGMGCAGERLLRVGQYGFSKLSSKDPQDEQLVILCPPYDTGKIAAFKHLESLLPEVMKTRWSLHPMLRPLHPELKQIRLSNTVPRPAFAICGDSGVLMDALARGVPVVTISDRKLASSHMTYEQVNTIDKNDLLSLADQASDHLQDDRRGFGFDDGVNDAVAPTNNEDERERC